MDYIFVIFYAEHRWLVAYRMILLVFRRLLLLCDIEMAGVTFGGDV